MLTSEFITKKYIKRLFKKMIIKNSNNILYYSMNSI